MGRASKRYERPRCAKCDQRDESTFRVSAPMDIRKCGFLVSPPSRIVDGIDFDGAWRCCAPHEAFGVLMALSLWAGGFSPRGLLWTTSIDGMKYGNHGRFPEAIWMRACRGLHVAGWIVHEDDGRLRLMTWQERHPDWRCEQPLVREIGKIHSSSYWSHEHGPAVFARDGSRCRYCGATKRLSLDHVKPRIQGGDDAADNLVVACRSCNSRKGGRTPEEAGMVLLAPKGNA